MFGGSVDAGLVLAVFAARLRDWGQVVLHEQARVHLEARGEKGFVDRSGVVEEKLRLDPLNAG